MRKYIKITAKKYIKIMKIGLGLLILILFSNCYKFNKEKIYKVEIDGYFDTVHILSGYDANEKNFKNKVEIYENEIERLHKLYTSYENYEGINNIKTINDNAGKKPVVVDEDIINLIEDSIKWNKEISNKVNIGAGSTISLWDNISNGTIPSEEKLKEAINCSNIDDIVINKTNNSIFLKKECMKLNVGGVAKGYAVEKIAQKLEKKGVDSFIISAGGNVKVIGQRKVENKNKTDLKKCREYFCIGIMPPIFYNDTIDKNNPYYNKNDYIAKIVAKNISIVTTGNYQRYFYINNKIYGHIIDLEKLEPVNNFSSVTIITKNSGLADFLSTTLYLMTYEEGIKLVEKLNEKYNEKIDVIWAFSNGNIKNTKGLIERENFIKYNFNTK